MGRVEREEDGNRQMLARQREFRITADVVAAALARFPEVEAVAVIGSVARPLWKEAPRFSRRIEIWHECGDLDLAVWLDHQQRLGELRRSLVQALRRAMESGKGISTANHQVDVFLFAAGTETYLGRLCHFADCPKRKPPCFVPGCGVVPYNRVFPEFVPGPDLLQGVENATLYRRGVGRLRSALDLPLPEDDLDGSGPPERLRAGAEGGSP